MRSGLGLATLALLVFDSTPLRADAVVSTGSATVTVGSDFQVPVSITGVTDLFGFQFDFSYNPQILQLVSINEGPFLSSSGDTTFFFPGIDDFGRVTGTADTILGFVPGVSGTGSLAVLNFEALAAGTSGVNLSNVKLVDSTLSDIPVTTQSGIVEVNAVPEGGAGWWLMLAIGLCASGDPRFRRWPPARRRWRNFSLHPLSDCSVR